MIEAGACCLQIENQVADEKQCGHQDGKVTVPHAETLRKTARTSLRFPWTRHRQRHHQMLLVPILKVYKTS